MCNLAKRTSLKPVSAEQDLYYFTHEYHDNSCPNTSADSGTTLLKIVNIFVRLYDVWYVAYAAGDAITIEMRKTERLKGQDYRYDPPDSWNFQLALFIFTLFFIFF